MTKEQQLKLWLQELEQMQRRVDDTKDRPDKSDWHYYQGQVAALQRVVNLLQHDIDSDTRQAVITPG